VAARFRTKYSIAGEACLGWEQGTPNCTPHFMPWLRLLGWVALPGLVVWLLRSALAAANPLAVISLVFPFAANGPAWPNDQDEEEELNEGEEEEEDEDDGGEAQHRLHVVSRYVHRSRTVR
jgi:hypothetical protein